MRRHIIIHRGVLTYPHPRSPKVRSEFDTALVACSANWASFDF